MNPRLPFLNKLHKDETLCRNLILFVIIVGFIARAVQLLNNRSLWLDEAALALNILQLNFEKLFGPLLYNQAAPGVFLFLTKWIASFFNYSEYSLRFIPFLSGALSLVLFRNLALKLLEPPAALIAISMLALSFFPNYFSVEFKQYSSDALITVILILMAYRVYTYRYSMGSIVLCGTVGGISIFFSHTAIFILAGAGTALFVEKLTAEKSLFRPDVIKITAMGAFWITIFGLSYFLIVKGTDHNSFYQGWSTNFAPLIPASINEVIWYQRKISEIIYNPTGLSMPPIILLAGLGGVTHLMVTKQRFQIFMLISPFFFLLIASGLGLYPLGGRLIFFTVPLLYILIAAGAAQIFHHLRKMHLLIGITFVAFLLHQPLKEGTKLLFVPYYREEIRPLVDHLRKERREGEDLYVYYGAIPAFKYYSRDLDWPFIEGSYSREHPEQYIAEIRSRFGGGPLWVLFSHSHKEEEEFITSHLDEMGELLHKRETRKASLYRYQITHPVTSE